MVTEDAGHAATAAASLAHQAPTVIDAAVPVGAALEQMLADHQAVAFVRDHRELVGVVTVEDLRFASDWAGPSCSTADAMTHALVDITPGADVVAAADAFSDGLHHWIAARRSREEG